MGCVQCYIMRRAFLKFLYVVPMYGCSSRREMTKNVHIRTEYIHRYKFVKEHVDMCRKCIVTNVVGS